MVHHYPFRLHIITSHKQRYRINQRLISFTFLVGLNDFDGLCPFHSYNSLLMNSCIRPRNREFIEILLHLMILTANFTTGQFPRRIFDFSGHFASSLMITNYISKREEQIYWSTLGERKCLFCKMISRVWKLRLFD